MTNWCGKELPHRKQQLTQDKSKVLRETEQNPFEDDDEPAPQQSSSQASFKPQSLPSATSKLAASGLSSAYTKPAESKKTKKDKKGSKKKAKPFNLEEEKDQMKSAIAEASVASTNLLNALKLINREHQRVSENASAVERFETCKKLRRQILRYVRKPFDMSIAIIYSLRINSFRFNLWRPSNGLAPCCMLTMSLLPHS